MEKRIKQILTENGWVYASPDEPIKQFYVNGDMALVVWFRQGNKEYNGKYVLEIEYYPND